MWEYLGDQDAAWGLQSIPKVAKYLTCAARPSAWALKLSEPNPHFTGQGRPTIGAGKDQHALPKGSSAENLWGLRSCVSSPTA